MTNSYSRISHSLKSPSRMRVEAAMISQVKNGLSHNNSSSNNNVGKSEIIVEIWIPTFRIRMDLRIRKSDGTVMVPLGLRGQEGGEGNYGGSSSDTKESLYNYSNKRNKEKNSSCNHIDVEFDASRQRIVFFKVESENHHGESNTSNSCQSETRTNSLADKKELYSIALWQKIWIQMGSKILRNRDLKLDVQILDPKHSLAVAAAEREGLKRKRELEEGKGEMAEGRETRRKEYGGEGIKKSEDHQIRQDVVKARQECVKKLADARKERQEKKREIEGEGVIMNIEGKQADSKKGKDEKKIDDSLSQIILAAALPSPLHSLSHLVAAGPSLASLSSLSSPPSASLLTPPPTSTTASEITSSSFLNSTRGLNHRVVKSEGRLVFNGFGSAVSGQNPREKEGMEGEGRSSLQSRSNGYGSKFEYGMESDLDPRSKFAPATKKISAADAHYGNASFDEKAGGFGSRRIEGREDGYDGDEYCYYNDSDGDDDNNDDGCYEDGDADEQIKGEGAGERGKQQTKTLKGIEEVKARDVCEESVIKDSYNKYLQVKKLEALNEKLSLEIAKAMERIDLNRRKHFVTALPRIELHLGSNSNSDGSETANDSNSTDDKKDECRRDLSYMPMGYRTSAKSRRVLQARRIALLELKLARLRSDSSEDKRRRLVEELEKLGTEMKEESEKI
uniref:Uncharacterized protein n=1 Tax=Polytomella parva TaxID=51329 RepID=A0A7S0YDN6_9CHLO|eukprot:CAMPEP_0175084304 /NCGR_PEP_ID=MMETSP0052_2-20121109/27968_1 /TAXON_ID=51329 ORGANISM="Polytomella parva, Strain SAG 63-3" /NCGR_SAMPLE_ID=MMETSP0052_2 /ASSEMBLY_ACC=CAM_ASM_000194 /LENGTH=677 /DNA_ID=CAMNT_0016356059 /DNA_START=454 /DNA_END=2487 /DNA_ORIENTATION=+